MFNNQKSEKDAAKQAANKKAEDSANKIPGLPSDSKKANTQSERNMQSEGGKN